MRILFLTNFYPPYVLGGQEYSCQDVVEGLQRRGHNTLVLTSMHGTDNRPIDEDGVSRSLYLEMDFVAWRNSLTLLTRRQAREAHNLQRLTEVFRTFEPELVFVWGMWNLPRSLAALAEKIYPERVVYRFAEYWPTLPSQYTLYWQAEGRTGLTRLLRRLVRPLALALQPHENGSAPLQFKHMICVSEAVKQELLAKGVDASRARVIRTGLDMRDFPAEADGRAVITDQRLRLLYAGRLAADKGVHTLLEAMDELVNQRGLGETTSLALAGSGDAQHEQSLRTEVAARALGSHISFLGQVPRHEMPVLYSQYDVLVMPSVWPEPFARVVLEGMAAGLVVVATAEGGTTEVIRDRQNGLLFATADACDLAEKIYMLSTDSALRAELSTAARKTILNNYTEERLLDDVEDYLLEVLYHR